MKKYILLTLTTALLFTISACNSNPTEKPTNEVAASVSTTTIAEMESTVKRTEPTKETTTTKTEKSTTVTTTTSTKATLITTTTKTKKAENTTTRKPKTNVTSKTTGSAKRFNKKLNVCTTKNEEYELLVNEYHFAAVAEMYTCGKTNTTAEKKLKSKFKEDFGFAPTADIEKEYIGTYSVDGYSTPQPVYRYKIFDTTYPLKDNEDYVVYHQTCTDGSPWVGFCIHANMDNHYKISHTDWYQTLHAQMISEFEDVIGMSVEEMRNSDKRYDIGCIIGTTVRTLDGELVDVLYIFCRSYADR